MKEQLIAASLVAAACGCDGKSATKVSEDEIPIAWDLGALTQEQRDREDVLLKEHLASVRETKEQDDGYSFRYDPGIALFMRMAEFVALEHLCCPFLAFPDSAPRAGSSSGGARTLHPGCTSAAAHA